MNTELTLTLNDVSFIITLLDQEAHRMSYYHPSVADDKQHYEFIARIRAIQQTLVSHISPDRFDNFFQVNDHLKHLVLQKEYNPQNETFDPLPDNDY